MTSPLIFWFRYDLRLTDNPGLTAAVKTDTPILPVFILDEQMPSDRGLGAASKWWLHHALESLSADLKKAGAKLILRRGDSFEVLTHLLEETKASGLYFSRAYDASGVALEKKLSEALDKKDVTCKRFSSSLLFEPEEIQTNSGDPYKVFTPFWKSCQQKKEPNKPVSKPKKIKGTDKKIKSDDLKDWDLRPTKPDWSEGMQKEWSPGEKGAQKRLEVFLENALFEYDDKRDRPDIKGTSMLSPHLRFGEISPRQCWHAVKTYLEKEDCQSNKGAETYLSEIGWREFSYHLLFNWPNLHNEAFRPEFSEFPWKGTKKQLKAWQKGKTGYPIVDAGMRQLWHIGWMHNRVRMIVGSFLVKHLLISWQDGESWFWDTLVDADPASNAAGWQWVAGSGADAAPYFRIFNPMLQSEKFDPKGDYIRKWVPELVDLSDKHIHMPWEADVSALEAAGIELGKTYPKPMVEHKQARQQALDSYERVKKAKN